MANYLKGLGDLATRANEILPSFDARINKFLCGHTAGIILDEFNEFYAYAIDRGVIIKSGMMQAHGYFGASDADTQINFVMPSGTQYVHLYAEIDLSVVPNRFEIKATPMSNSSAYTFQQDNLRLISNGKFQFPIWQMTLTASTIILTDKRVYINKPLNAVNAELTDVAAGYTTGGGIAGKFADHQSKLDLKAPLASPALTGTPTVPTAAQSVNNTQAASTAYVRTAISDVKNITSASFAFAGQTVTVRRQVNFVSCSIDFSTSATFARGATLGTIPSGFRPNSVQRFALFHGQVLTSGMVSYGTGYGLICEIATNGAITVYCGVGEIWGYSISNRLLANFGYEIT